MIFNGTQYPLLFWACHTGHTAQVRLSLLIDINSHGNKLPFRIVSVPLLFPLWRCNCSPQGPHIYMLVTAYSFGLVACTCLAVGYWDGKCGLDPVCPQISGMKPWCMWDALEIKRWTSCLQGLYLWTLPWQKLFPWHFMLQWAKVLVGLNIPSLSYVLRVFVWIPNSKLSILRWDPQNVSLGTFEVCFFIMSQHQRGGILNQNQYRVWIPYMFKEMETWGAWVMVQW